MKCLQTIKHIVRNSLFVLCLLTGSIVKNAIAAPEAVASAAILELQKNPKIADKILKKDLDTIFSKIRSMIAPSQYAHFDSVCKPMIEARNDFFNPHNNDGFAVHAPISERNLARWDSEIVNNPAYQSVKLLAEKLSGKLHCLVVIFKKYINKHSCLDIIPLGLDLRPYEHLLPKHLNKGLISLIKKRLSC